MARNPSLRALGAQVDVAAAYRTVPPEGLAARARGAHLLDGDGYRRWAAFASREERIVAYADKRAGQHLESMDARFASWRRRYPAAWTEAELRAVRARADRLEADVCRAAGVAPAEVARLAWTGAALRTARRSITADFLTGLTIPRDDPGEERRDAGYPGFERRCCKMATGTGKSTVAAMLAAWSILNKQADRGDARFADTVLIVCPNVTIRRRLGEFDPRTGDASLYRTRDLVPPAMMARAGWC
jgi:hypothetical protein